MTDLSKTSGTSPSPRKASGEIKSAVVEPGAQMASAMQYVAELVLGNPGVSPDEIVRRLKHDIDNAEPGSPLAAIGETLARLGGETAIEDILLQEAQSIQFMNEDCLPDEPITARVLREVTGGVPPLYLLAKPLPDKPKPVSTKTASEKEANRISEAHGRLVHHFIAAHGRSGRSFLEIYTWADTLAPEMITGFGFLDDSEFEAMRKFSLSIEGNDPQWPEGGAS